MHRLSQHRLFQHFCGSSPALRVLAWLAVSSLVFSWASLGLIFFDFHLSSLGAWGATALLCAILLGISSFCALGGISAALALLTIFGLCIYGLLAGGAAS
jgi:hypothetical protein